MAFLPNGNWIPDQMMNNAGSTLQRGSLDMGPQNMQVGVPQITPQSNKLQFYPQANMQALQQNPQMMAMKGQVFGGPGYGPTPQNQAPIANAVQASIPLHAQNMYGALPNTPPQQNQGNAPMASVGPLNPMPFQAPQYAPSLTQSVDMSDPQARQNYLKALGNASGAASNNAWRNPVGMHGQGPQAGFAGFQQNGMPMPNAQAAQFQQQNSQLGWAENQATSGQASTQEQAGGNYVTASSPTGDVHSSYTHPLAPGYAGGSGYGGYGGNRGHGGSPGTGQSSGYNGPQQNPQQPPQNQGQPGQAPAPGGRPPRPNQGQYPQAPSDINSKKHIQDGQSQLQEFLDSLGVYDYEYKDPKYGEGRRISPMAQEIEQTPLGKAAISTNDEGYKIVDYGKLGGTMLASLAMLNHKNNSLEQEVEDLKKSIMTNLKNKGKK